MQQVCVGGHCHTRLLEGRCAMDQLRGEEGEGLKADMLMRIYHDHI